MALAVMAGFVAIIRAAGWSEFGLPAFALGFGGTLFTLYHIQKWLFRAMIQRHDDVRDEEEVAP